MSRLPITPGVKERVSANAGRIYAAFVRNAPEEVAQDTHGCAQAAVQGAIDLEYALTAALTPEEDNA